MRLILFLLFSTGTTPIRHSLLILFHYTKEVIGNNHSSDAFHTKERQSINNSLRALGKVIMALGDKSSRESGIYHVPYRSSPLTRVLQDGLGGNSMTVVLATISPADDNFLETMDTLRFANLAKQLRNCVTRSRSRSVAMVRLEGEQLQKLAQSSSSPRGAAGYVFKANLHAVTEIESVEGNEQKGQGGYDAWAALADSGDESSGHEEQEQEQGQGQERGQGRLGRDEGSGGGSGDGGDDGKSGAPCGKKLVRSHRVREVKVAVTAKPDDDLYRAPQERKLVHSGQEGRAKETDADDFALYSAPTPQDRKLLRSGRARGGDVGDQSSDEGGGGEGEAGGAEGAEGDEDWEAPEEGEDLGAQELAAELAAAAELDQRTVYQRLSPQCFQEIDTSSRPPSATLDAGAGSQEMSLGELLPSPASAALAQAMRTAPRPIFPWGEREQLRFSAAIEAVEKGAARALNNLDAKSCAFLRTMRTQLGDARACVFAAGEPAPRGAALSWYYQLLTESQQVLAALAPAGRPPPLAGPRASSEDLPSLRPAAAPPSEDLPPLRQPTPASAPRRSEEELDLLRGDAGAILGRTAALAAIAAHAQQQSMSTISQVDAVAEEYEHDFAGGDVFADSDDADGALGPQDSDDADGAAEFLSPRAAWGGPRK